MRSDPFRTTAGRRLSVLSALLLGAGLLLSACGEGDTPAPTAPPAPAPAPPPPAPEPPPTPEGVGVTAYGPDFVEWSWSAADGATGYEVQFGAEAPADSDETVARTADEASYRGEGLETETAYYFRVRSFAGDGESRLVSDWSDQATAQIGRFLTVLGSTEEPIDSDLSPPPEIPAQVAEFFEYSSETAFTDRGLPVFGAGPDAFGCRTPELQQSQAEEWLNGSVAFALATLEVLFAEDSDALDTAIADARSVLDDLLDGFAANLHQGHCGLFLADDVFVWEGEEEVISVTLRAPDEEESVDLGVIRVLAAAVPLDPAAAAGEASHWWIVKDATSLGEPLPPLLATPSLQLPWARPPNLH